MTIALGKEKYQTSVKEKVPENVEWHEECELQIPQQGNTAEVVLTAFHRNFLGVDEFLGMINVPLSSFDVYERPKNRWFATLIFNFVFHFAAQYSYKSLNPQVHSEHKAG